MSTAVKHTYTGTCKNDKRFKNGFSIVQENNVSVIPPIPCFILDPLSFSKKGSVVELLAEERSDLWDHRVLTVVPAAVTHGCYCYSC